MKLSMDIWGRFSGTRTLIVDDDYIASLQKYLETEYNGVPTITEDLVRSCASGEDPDYTITDKESGYEYSLSDVINDCLYEDMYESDMEIWEMEDDDNSGFNIVE